MKKSTFDSAAALALFLAITTQAWAMDERKTEQPTAAMAQVLINLNHYPSDSEKAALGKIAADESVPQAQREIATAIINLKHAATAEDKAKLEKILADEGAPKETKELARIVHDLNHMPSSEDKEQLQAMIE